jgi:hypothetical protein
MSNTLYSLISTLMSEKYEIRVHTCTTTEYQEHPTGQIYDLRGNILYIGKKTVWSYAIPLDKILFIEVMSGPANKRKLPKTQ